MNSFPLTIFTPTYNRAFILPELKKSLDRQDNFEFEWLIIDDGSTDNTEALVNQWMHETLEYTIRYIKVQNGGKPRAINKACELANAPWMFIVDSDDHLADNIIGFIRQKISEIDADKSFVGVGGLRGHDNNTPWRRPLFDVFVDATNLDRSKYGLDIDCNEVYRVETLKKHPFVVWPREIFTPEEVVLNEMSLSGYKLRWFNRVFVVSKYLDDGMTKGSWNLIKKNPMGYAMMYNHRLLLTCDFKQKVYNVCQFISLVMYAGNYKYLLKCQSKSLLFVCFPLGCLLSVRRKNQFKNISK